jgi:hypothetical protein
VTPDFTIPTGFLFTNGGTVTYSGSLDSITYGSLPINGVTSLSRDLSTHAVFAATNSPTNFATQSGSVPEPGTAGILPVSGICITVRRYRGC